MHKKQIYWGQPGFRDWCLDAKKKKHHKCHCAGLCETFDNRLLSALTELDGATNNNALSILNNNNNNNNKTLFLDVARFLGLSLKLSNRSR